MSDYSSIDFFWSNRGDYALDHRGDIADTEDNPLRSLVQEMRTRVEASVGDWPIYPTIGAGLDDFIGEVNNRTTADEIKVRVAASLTSDGLIKASDLQVQVTPLSSRAIRVSIMVNVMNTPGVESNIEWLNFSYLYDIAEKGTIYALGG